MLEALGRRLTAWSQRWIPDPFIFALLLSFLTYVMGILIARQSPWQMILHWQKDFWGLLAFSMQMALVLVTGHAVASSPPVKRLLMALAQLPQNPRQAVLLVGFIAALSGLINWGLALVVGALIAVEVGKSARQRGIKVDYPLLAAAAYLGQMIWHGGLSGSAPLTVATEGHFLADKIGVIPISETLFNPMNYFVSLGLLVLAPWLASRIHPSRPEDVREMPAALIEADQAASSSAAAAEPAARTPAEALENARWISLLVGAAGLAYAVHWFATQGFKLDLNLVNWIFLFTGILLHGTPIRYVHAVSEATRGAAGIILQFPFYAGIMSMMSNSGLVAIIADWFVQISTPFTFPLFTFLSACLVNIFVPSGGGQWAVQGPIMIDAALRLGVPVDKTIMGIAYGDQLTNMIQPFWALALLGITRLQARDIIGYSCTIMLFALVWIAIGVLFLPS